MRNTFDRWQVEVCDGRYQLPRISTFRSLSVLGCIGRTGIRKKKKMQKKKKKAIERNSLTTDGKIPLKVGSQSNLMCDAMARPQILIETEIMPLISSWLIIRGIDRPIARHPEIQKSIQKETISYLRIFQFEPMVAVHFTIWRWWLESIASQCRFVSEMSYSDAGNMFRFRAAVSI